jgi:hypothetical protein
MNQQPSHHFVDGVLSVFKLKADRVEVKEELCVDGVCINADDLRDLLDRNNVESSASTPEPEPTPEELAGENEGGSEEGEEGGQGGESSNQNPEPTPESEPEAPPTETPTP